MAELFQLPSEQKKEKSPTPLAQLMLEIGKTPLLSAAEEKTLAATMKRGTVAMHVLHTAFVEALEKDPNSKALLEVWGTDYHKDLFGTEEDAINLRVEGLGSKKSSATSYRTIQEALVDAATNYSWDQEALTNLKANLAKVLGATSELPSEANLLFAEFKKLGDDRFKARTHFQNANRRLVMNRALKRAQKSGGGEDAILDDYQAGSIGLLRAVEGFDGTRDGKFSTYGVFWIKRLMRKHSDAAMGNAEIPAHIMTWKRKLDHHHSTLKASGTFLSDFEVLTQVLGVEDSKAQRIASSVKAARGSLATNASGLEEESCPIDSNALKHVADSYDLDPKVISALNEDEERLSELLQHLDARDRTIVIHRYGLLGVEEKTLFEVGDIIGVSRERIRQVQSDALGRFRILLRETPVGIEISDFLGESTFKDASHRALQKREMGFDVRDGGVEEGPRFTGWENVRRDEGEFNTISPDAHVSVLEAGSLTNTHFQFNRDKVITLEEVVNGQTKTALALNLNASHVAAKFTDGKIDWTSPQTVQLVRLSQIKLDPKAAIDPKKIPGAQMRARILDIRKSGLEEPLIISQDPDHKGEAILLERGLRLLACQAVANSQQTDFAHTLVPCRIHAQITLSQEERLVVIQASKLLAEAPGLGGSAYTVGIFRQATNSTQAEVARQLRIDERRVRILLSIATLPESLRQMLDENRLGRDVAYELARLAVSDDTKIQLALKFEAERFTTAQVISVMRRFQKRATAQGYELESAARKPIIPAVPTTNVLVRTTSFGYPPAQIVPVLEQHGILRKGDGLTALKLDAVELLKFTLNKKTFDTLGLKPSKHTWTFATEWHASILGAFSTEELRPIDLMMYWNACAKKLSALSESKISYDYLALNKIDFIGLDKGSRSFERTKVIDWLNRQTKAIAVVALSQIPQLNTAKQIALKAKELLDSPCRNILVTEAALSDLSVQWDEGCTNNLRTWLKNNEAKIPGKIQSSFAMDEERMFSLAEIYALIAHGIEKTIILTGGKQGTTISTHEVQRDLVPFALVHTSNQATSIHADLVVAQLLHNAQIIQGLIQKMNEQLSTAVG